MKRLHNIIERAEIVEMIGINICDDADGGVELQERIDIFTRFANNVRTFATLPLPLMKGSLPPMTALGSRPASIKICVSMPVVVVLPCVPETAMGFANFFVKRPSITERSNVGIPFARAATSSGLSCFAAAVYTTTSASRYSPRGGPCAPGCRSCEYVRACRIH